MLGLNKEQGIIAGGIAAVGAVALVATGFGVRACSQTKRALSRTKELKECVTALEKTLEIKNSKISELEDNLKDVDGKVKDLNQNKINLDKLNKLEIEVDKLRSSKEKEITENVIKAMEEKIKENQVTE